MNAGAIRGRLTGTVSAAGAIALLPWIAYLSASLPTTYRASDWSDAWVGFDLLLLLSLAATAILTYRDHPARAMLGFASGLLMVADAWFDITTSSATDMASSVASAVVVELPFAAFLIISSVRALTPRSESPPAH